MKLATLFLLSLLSLPAFQPPKDEPKRATAKGAVAKEAVKVEIPAGAVKSDDGAYRYTDSQGKKWIYRKTPFGIARVEDKPAEPIPVETYASVKATEDGDSIRFERPGPFGTYKWQRKKTELNEMEKAVWDREQSRTAAKQD
jgi:hypothetical protein